MAHRSDLIAAALLGLGGGLRSFAPPVALAARDRGPLAGPARFIAFGAATGEVIADKQPTMSSRSAPRGLAFRLGFSGTGGRQLGGWSGGGVAAATALISASAGARLRATVRDRPGEVAAAVAEDALSYALALAAVRNVEYGKHARPHTRRSMQTRTRPSSSRSSLRQPTRSLIPLGLLR
jgi:hypothetical protein